MTSKLAPSYDTCEILVDILLDLKKRIFEKKNDFEELFRQILTEKCPYEAQF